MNNGATRRYGETEMSKNHRRSGNSHVEPLPMSYACYVIKIWLFHEILTSKKTNLKIDAFKPTGSKIDLNHPDRRVTRKSLASPWQTRTSGSLSGLTSLFFYFFWACVLAGLADPKIDAIYDVFRPF